MSWADWTGRDFILNPPYLGGQFLETGFPNAISWDEPGLVVVRETHAGTHKVWRAYSEPKAPVGMSGRTISINAYTVSEADYTRLLSLSRAAAITTYADGRQVVDRFPNATAGQSLKLTRPLALGTVGTVTEEFFPTIVKLGGVVTPSAASVSGQTVTVNTSGVLEIIYTPLYSVVVLGNNWSIGQFNDLQFDSFQLVEVIQTEFN